MPCSSWSPRSSNSIPEPATRSLTVLDTTTSPARAFAATRAPMCTAMPRDLAVHDLALTRVQPARTSSPSRTPVDDGARAADRARRSVEGGEEPVAGRIDLAPAEAHRAPAARARGGARAARCQARSPSSERVPVDSTMSVNSTVASTRSGSASSQPPDSHTSLRNRFVAPPMRPPASAERQVADAGELDESRSRDPAGQVACRLRRHDLVVGAVKDQRRHPHGRQHMPDVDLLVHPEERLEHSRAGAVTEVVEERLAARRRRTARAIAPSPARPLAARRHAARARSPGSYSSSVRPHG